ncbi:hypothetical protein PM082_008548 [Marasmius tenuissimus]|nr:hypothetical protein PM082_008548 [Marasmius tenuissimus]
MTAGPSKSTHGVYSFTHRSSSTEVHAGSRRTTERVRRLESRQASDDAQTSLTLDSKVISKVMEEPSETEAKAGTYATSLISSNNFINFCAKVNLPLTNGMPITESSCNPAPMGIIPSTDRIPSLKFQFPLNGAVLAINKPFTVLLGINNLATENLVNRRTNYLAAPQQVDPNGLVLGHAAIVIEQLDTLNQTATTNPRQFIYFKTVVEKLHSGYLGFDVPGNLPAGSYRLSSVTTDANYHSIVVPLYYSTDPSTTQYTSRFEVKLLHGRQSARPMRTECFHVKTGIRIHQAPTAMRRLRRPSFPHKLLSTFQKMD